MVVKREAREIFRSRWNADLWAHGERRLSWRHRYWNPMLVYQYYLRRVEYYLTLGGPMAVLLRVYYRRKLILQGLKTGISIPPGVFDGGLYIAHFGSIVVHSGVRVGPRCQIHSGTNIGGSGGGAVPVLGSDVFVGPGAVIAGGVVVGSRSAIGANSVVLSDVPDGVTAVGAPARVVSAKSSEALRPKWQR